MNDPLPSPAAVLELMRTRRSVRRFRPDELPEETISKLVEAAISAPSAGNRQAYRLLTVTSKERISAMSDAVRSEVASLRASLRPDAAADAGAYLDNFLHFAQAPLVVAPIHRIGVDLLAAATRAESQLTYRSEADSLSSVAAAIQNLLLYAHACGLGACWMTGPLVAAPALERILEVPQGWKLSALVPVGLPSELPPERARRGAERVARRL